MLVCGSCAQACPLRSLSGAPILHLLDHRFYTHTCTHTHTHVHTYAHNADRHCEGERRVRQERGRLSVGLRAGARYVSCQQKDVHSSWEYVCGRTGWVGALYTLHTPSLPTKQHHQRHTHPSHHHHYYHHQHTHPSHHPQTPPTNHKPITDWALPVAAISTLSFGVLIPLFLKSGVDSFNAGALSAGTACVRTLVCVGGCCVR